MKNLQKKIRLPPPQALNTDEVSNYTSQQSEVITPVAVEQDNSRVEVIEVEESSEEPVSAVVVEEEKAEVISEPVSIPETELTVPDNKTSETAEEYVLVDTTVALEDKETIADESALPEAEETQSIEEEPLEAMVWYLTYPLDIKAYRAHAYITYPDFITKEEVLNACASAYNKYSEYLDGVSVSVIEDGLAELTYPDSLTSSDFEVALAVLDEELTPYVDRVIASYNNTQDVVIVDELCIADITEEQQNSEGTMVVATIKEPEVATSITASSTAVAEEEMLDESKESVEDSGKTAPAVESTTSTEIVNNVAVVHDEENKKNNVVDYLSYGRESVSVWGTGYGMAEKVAEGKSFNAKRFTRSYIYAFNVEYDYRLTKLFNVGVKTGHEGVIFHVGGYDSQIPLILTVGMVPYERKHSKLAFDLGVGIDVVQSALKKGFSLIGDFSLSYSYKLGGHFALGVATDIRCSYTFSDGEFRLEFMPVLLGASFTF